MKPRLPVCAVVLAAMLACPAVWTMDRVRKETRADEAVARYGVTGRGVTIAIIDRGIDWRNPDFRRPDGKTRIRAMLDLSGQNWCSPKNPPGVEYMQEQIDAALAGKGSIELRDAVGHGTLTAGVAASNGQAFAGGRYRGIAPEADLLIAKVTSDGAPAHDGFPDEKAFVGCIDQALEWVDKQAAALGQPVVATINSGTQWGPIDGTSAVSRKIDAFFGLDRPGRVYVSAAGDEGNYPNHAGGDFNERGVAIRFEKKEAKDVYASLWYSGDVPAEVSIFFDDGTSVGPVKPEQSQTVKGISVAQPIPGKEFYPWQSTSGDRSVWFHLAGNHQGPGEVLLRAIKPATGRFDLYSDIHGVNWLPVVVFLDHLVPGRLNDYASTKSAIVVGNSVVRRYYRDVDGQSHDIFDAGEPGGLWVYSPAGPTRDGRGVDVVAPGQNAFASIGRDSYWGTLRPNLIEAGGGWYCRFGGTSASAPVVVGTVALMLQKRPTLTEREVRRILCDTAKADEVTGVVPNASWGCGRLDVLSALERTVSYNR